MQGQRCLCADSTGVENTASRFARLRAKKNEDRTGKYSLTVSAEGNQNQWKEKFKEELRQTERSACQDDDMTTGAPSCLISQQTGRGKSDIYRQDTLLSSVNRVFLNFEHTFSDDLHFALRR